MVHGVRFMKILKAPVIQYVAYVKRKEVVQIFEIVILKNQRLDTV